MEVEWEDAEVEEVHVVEDEADDDQAEEAQAEAGQEEEDGQAGQGDAPGVEAVPPPPLQPERWTVRVHQTRGLCFFFRALRLLFHRLHMIVEIEYVGAPRTHPRYLEEWLVSTHIRAPDYEYRGTVDVAMHHALAARATFEVGISDAASQALSVLYHYGGADLDNSPWRHFPRCPEGEMRSVIVGVQNLLNTRLVAQVGITAALHTQMERTAMELQQVRSQLAATRRENEALRPTLQGVDPAAQAQDTADLCIADSPPRKRTNFDPQHPTTTVLP
ncbi:hypothetical protein C2845_PM18G02930 [Panicum miliaceum]|uniref:Uncharacterized protein n=1 Tax=Panicum miliaceum TaxID=4540 RepID=A0A3L6PFS5_PANMI|nr:hypothetical protein C2845_PM18G02930 [Panicum miliaceum]